MDALAQSEFFGGSLPVKKPLVEALAIDPADLKNDWSQSPWRGLGRRVSLALSRLLMTFCVGIGVTFAWLSYGDAAWEAISSSVPRLGWLGWRAAPLRQRDMIAPAPSSPGQQHLNAVSLNLDAAWQRVHQIAVNQEQMANSVERLTAGQEQMAHSVEQLNAKQEQMAHNVDQLTAGQAQLTREMTKLRSVEQYILHKSSEAALQRATPKRSTQSPR